MVQKISVVCVLSRTMLEAEVTKIETLSTFVDITVSGGREIFIRITQINVPSVMEERSQNDGSRTWDLL